MIWMTIATVCALLSGAMFAFAFFGEFDDPKVSKRSLK
jgi:hypothetical protein